MTQFSIRSLLLAAIVLSNCITWTASKHSYTHTVSGHRTRHRRQGAVQYHSLPYVLPGGEGEGWGEWGEVSPCSRTCGGGVASQKRICLQLGSDGSPQCSGGDTKYFSCQTQDCPEGSGDFREQQCSAYDNVTFSGTLHKWVPYTKAPNPCELNCMPRGERFYYRHSLQVVDGTRCNEEDYDICVSGTCQPVGCDKLLGSSAREDKCRECRGTGANCETVAGILDRTYTNGYNDLLLIPKGATNIIISERAQSMNYLGIRAVNNTYYLNGDYRIDFPRTLEIAGTLWNYERSQQGFAAPDKLRCRGPTNQQLILTLLLKDANVGIEYEYSVPKGRGLPKNRKYNWALDEFTPCSEPCAGGYQTRNVTCQSENPKLVVDEALCDRELKPPDNQTCNTEACNAQWTVESWGECSKKCGIGGTRSREVHCTKVISKGYLSIVGDDSCTFSLGPKPEQSQTCNENATCPTWFAGPWKPCNKLCGDGKQTRQVVCYQKNGSRKEVISDEECEDEMPPTEKRCMVQPCEGVDWVLSEWTKCDSCLLVNRTRTALCATNTSVVVDDSFCAYHGTPVTEEPCKELPRCDVMWYATQWSKCSVECGKGVQMRDVFCGEFNNDSVMKVNDTRCAGQQKYNNTKDCEVPLELCPAKRYAGPWGDCTSKCGNGNRHRVIMCLSVGNQTACSDEVKQIAVESCNSDPCEEVSTEAGQTPDPLDDEFCIDSDLYPEEGLDGDGSTTVGDGVTSNLTIGNPRTTVSTAEHESTFTDGEFIEVTNSTTGLLSDFAGTGDETTTDSSTTDENTELTTATSGSNTENTTSVNGTTPTAIDATNVSDNATTGSNTENTTPKMNGSTPTATDATNVSDNVTTGSNTENSTPIINGTTPTAINATNVSDNVTTSSNTEITTPKMNGTIPTTTDVTNVSDNATTGSNTENTTPLNGTTPTAIDATNVSDNVTTSSNTEITTPKMNGTIPTTTDATNVSDNATTGSNTENTTPLNGTTPTTTDATNVSDNATTGSNTENTTPLNGTTPTAIDATNVSDNATTGSHTENTTPKMNGSTPTATDATNVSDNVTTSSNTEITTPKMNGTIPTTTDATNISDNATTGSNTENTTAVNTTTPTAIDATNVSDNATTGSNTENTTPKMNGTTPTATDATNVSDNATTGSNTENTTPKINGTTPTATDATNVSDNAKTTGTNTELTTPSLIETTSPVSEETTAILKKLQLIAKDEKMDSHESYFDSSEEEEEDDDDDDDDDDLYSEEPDYNPIDEEPIITERSKPTTVYGETIEPNTTRIEVTSGNMTTGSTESEATTLLVTSEANTNMSLASVTTEATTTEVTKTNETTTPVTTVDGNVTSTKTNETITTETTLASGKASTNATENTTPAITVDGNVTSAITNVTRTAETTLASGEASTNATEHTTPVTTVDGNVTSATTNVTSTAETTLASGEASTNATENTTPVTTVDGNVTSATTNVTRTAETTLASGEASTNATENTTPVTTVDGNVTSATTNVTSTAETTLASGEASTNATENTTPVTTVDGNVTSATTNVTSTAETTLASGEASTNATENTTPVTTVDGNVTSATTNVTSTAETTLASGEASTNATENTTPVTTVDGNVTSATTNVTSTAETTLASGEASTNATENTTPVTTVDGNVTSATTNVTSTAETTLASGEASTNATENTTPVTTVDGNVTSATTNVTSTAETTLAGGEVSTNANANTTPVTTMDGNVTSTKINETSTTETAVPVSSKTTAETINGITEANETTKSENTESPNITETSSIITTKSFTGTTESAVAGESGSTKSTEESSTLSSAGTDSSSESLTTEGSSGITRWDLSTTVAGFGRKQPRICKPCELSRFGCCPDRKTPAKGPFEKDCSKPPTCALSLYGCCPDGVSAIRDPQNPDCPVEPCEQTLYGCCKSDNITAAQGNDQEGCPPPPPACLSSEYGCCKNGTQAQGPNKEGCPEISTTATPDTATLTTATPATATPATVKEHSTTDTTNTEEATESTVWEGTPSGATHVIESCIESEYGCCFDNKTAATGPELQGCPCHTSLFGCCPDGVALAEGLHYEGCAKSCNSTTFGCCSDGKTPAHGPDQEGCCLTLRYGCCTDNYQPAEGPHLEGCGCHNSRFGCCPDNASIATGPNNEGCSCQFSEHGCCPDRHTEASGPDFEGCTCHTYQYGCCPDGVTVAQGPNGDGCYCDHSPFGCCGDGQTHAKGLNHQGCDCATSKYGCCVDGISEATGSKFEGCTEKPLDRQAACSLKFERGTCHNYTVQWYYDTVYGGCSRFWYGGCEGNGNRFSSKEECEDTCVSPPSKDACRLPQVKGACLSHNERWYYNTEREMCSNFIYGGCLGNANNFESHQLCQAKCEPDKTTNQCSLTIERGRCNGNYLRWGYNQEKRGCDQFVWGGCEGNSNRFISEAACLLRCKPPGEPLPECLMAQDAGNCTDTEARWSFSQTENRCVPFYYTGCGGNSNKYTTREECQEACPSGYVPDLCTLPSSAGQTCTDWQQKWFFDTKNQRCELFYYGGCEGNDNRFDSEQECNNRCSLPSTTPAPRVATTAPASDTCQLPMRAGSCTDSVMRWFYDAASDSCSQFTYGGCDGNDNRFETREACESRCKSGQAPTVTHTNTTIRVEESIPECAVPAELELCSRQSAGEVWFYNRESGTCEPHENIESGVKCRTTGVFNSEEACERACGAFRKIDVCQYAVDAGPCNDYSSKYYYNKITSRCEEFAYGGCFGGANRFSTEQECEQVCMTAIDPCTLPADTGNCVGRILMWYYNQQSDQCEQFVFGGCGGNDNKFESSEACEGQCRRQLILTNNRQPTEECRTPESLAPCGTNETVFYFDEYTKACEAADIGGCGPSPSHYVSEEECLRRCGAFKEIDVCRAQLDPGPCKMAVTKFYYDAASGSCQEFTYGGCNGGYNRFSTREECESFCANAGPEPSCLLPVMTGEVCAELPQRRWHYDVKSVDCLVFSYQGCGGNENNFRSYDECVYQCRVETNFEPPSACVPYLEECTTLASTCVYNVTLTITPEGCTRCECAEPVNCDAQRRECDALRCRYGIERAASSDGCEQCQCLEDPCTRSTCAASERCVLTKSSDPVSQEVHYAAHCEPPSACVPYLEECTTLASTCVNHVRHTITPEGCTRCECAEPVNCDAQRRECDALRCRYGIARAALSDGCEQCQCLEDPCARSTCAATERCVLTKSSDPVSQEVHYAAHCESNEIEKCDEYKSECLALRCADGVQRMRVGGCVRCSCVREETDCAPLRRECDMLKCVYGVNRTTGGDGCESAIYYVQSQNSCLDVNAPRYIAGLHNSNNKCACLDPPCQSKQCAEGERCITMPYRDPITMQYTRYFANCQPVNKPGACPAGDARETLARSTDGACRRECLDDAECRGVLKCCARGCSQLCVPPSKPTTPLPSTTHRPDERRAPEVNPDTSLNPPQAQAAEGSKATLRCYFHGNPPPTIAWRFGEVTIEGDKGRYHLLSDGALEIVSVNRDDSGVYICLAQNEYGSAQHQITLTVTDPVRTTVAIVAAEGSVTGVLGQPLVLRCLAYGYPPPAIYWFRGRGTEMVPYSNALYEARGLELRIRRLTVDTLGEYECQAYNGQDRAVTQSVAVYAYRPPGENKKSQYLVDRDVLVVTTPAPTRPTPRTTTKEPVVVIQPYSDPVRTSLPASSSVDVGEQLSLPCEVSGFPEPEVSWTKDDAPLVSSERMWIAGSRLTIERAEVADSGVYSCHAANVYSSASSAVRVVVQEVPISASCVDNPTFANCALIVASKFCSHPYYSGFCCKSCVEAGQLNPRDALSLQLPYRK